MKHDNVVVFDAFMWNWNKSNVCNYAIFITFCINEALSNEIRWPMVEERAQLGSQIIDGIFIEIRKSWNNEAHKTWFNRHKKMYYMNNMIILDHCGLFIYLDTRYLGSYQDVTILRQSNLYKNWQQFFKHRDDYFEYLLGDPGYMGEKMFVMH
jgi:hypothetical protein